MGVRDRSVTHGGQGANPRSRRPTPRDGRTDEGDRVARLQVVQETWYVSNSPFTDGDRVIADVMSYWVNFAAMIHPNGSGLSPWPP
jgi:hypothetical protein